MPFNHSLAYEKKKEDKGKKEQIGAGCITHIALLALLPLLQNRTSLRGGGRKDLLFKHLQVLHMHTLPLSTKIARIHAVGLLVYSSLMSL